MLCVDARLPGMPGVVLQCDFVVEGGAMRAVALCVFVVDVWRCSAWCVRLVLCGMIGVGVCVLPGVDALDWNVAISVVFVVWLFRGAGYEMVCGVWSARFVVCAFGEWALVVACGVDVCRPRGVVWWSALSLACSRIRVMRCGVSC